MLRISSNPAYFSTLQAADSCWFRILAHNPDFFFMVLWISCGVFLWVVCSWIIIHYMEINDSVKVSQLKIPEREFIQQVLKWCEENVGRRDQPYRLRISHDNGKQPKGLYFFRGKIIKIFVSPTMTIIDLVDIIIHEYTHYLEISSSTTNNLYYTLLNEKGYWNNPFEVSARRMADKHKGKCFRWILNQNWV